MYVYLVLTVQTVILLEYVDISSIKHTSKILPSLAEEGRAQRIGARRSLQFLSNVPSLLMFLLTFSLRMERITLMMLTLLSGTLRRTHERYHSNMRTGYIKSDLIN